MIQYISNFVHKEFRTVSMSNLYAVWLNSEFYGNNKSISCDGDLSTRFFFCWRSKQVKKKKKKKKRKTTQGITARFDMANQCDLYMKRKKKKDSQGLRYWNGHRPVFGTYTIVLKQIAAMKVIWPQLALLGFKCLAGLLFIDIIIHNIFKYIWVCGR